MGLCDGKEIDLRDIGRNLEQTEMGKILGPLLTAGLSSGATPFGGQLSQVPDPAQMAAMNTMMGIGGYGGYQPNQYPLGMGPNLGPGVQAGPVGATGTSTGAAGPPGVLGPSSKSNISGPGPTGVGNIGPTGPSARPDKPRPSAAYPRVNPWPQTGSGPPMASSEAQPLSHAANVRSVYPGYGPIGPVGPVGPPVGVIGPPVGMGPARTGAGPAGMGLGGTQGIPPEFLAMLFDPYQSR